MEGAICGARIRNELCSLLVNHYPPLEKGASETHTREKPTSNKGKLNNELAWEQVIASIIWPDGLSIN